MAQRYWPGQPENALGREFRLREGGEPYQVVGVVADYKVDTPGRAPKPYIHLPLGRQETFGNYVVRTSVAGERDGAGAAARAPRARSGARVPRQGNDARPGRR